MTADAIYKISLIVLLIIMVPISVINFRTLRISNMSCLVILGGGVVACLAREFVVTGDASQTSLLWWLLIAAGWFIAFATRAIGGGVAKMMIALLPWFPVNHYLIMMTISFFGMAGVGFLLSRLEKIQEQPGDSGADAMPAALGILVGVGAQTAYLLSV
jgi:Flp pilus assembly protein protease CpaA